MCATCGCAAGGAVVRLIGPGQPDQAGHDHGHGHGHGNGHGNGHGHEAGHGGEPQSGDSDRTVLLQRKVLAKNDDIADRNRDWLRQRGVFMLNLMSSPGAGKTTLLERTSRDLAGRLAVAVIEGDQETALDARRIMAAGCQVVQINTGAGCHLDAEMVARGLTALDPPRGSTVVVENVGNLVCPALFDLGEAVRVVLASVPEGADKPAKYPHMFRQADLVLLTKTDLLPYLSFDLDRYLADLRRVSPGARLMQLSAVTGEGMPDFYDWLFGQGPRPPPAGPRSPAARGPGPASRGPVPGRGHDRLAEADPAVVAWHP